MVGKVLHATLDVHPSVGAREIAAVGLAHAPQRVTKRLPNRCHTGGLRGYLVDNRLQRREPAHQRVDGRLDVSQLCAIRLRDEGLALLGDLRTGAGPIM